MGYTVPVLRGPAPVRPFTVQPPVRATLQAVITKVDPVEALSVSQRNAPDHKERESK